MRFLSYFNYFVEIMTLLQIKTIFFDRLSTLYPKNEIDSIFYLTMGYLLNYSKIEIHGKLSLNLTGEMEIKVLGIRDRLAHNEPIQYITGYTEFYELRLNIDNRALIPRPETELLVNIILNETSRDKKLKIIDLCTGSGCIALALTANLPYTEVSATDISKEALELAEQNSKENNLTVNFICDSLLEPKKNYETYDIITSNPPYVREEEKKHMHRNILEYEPELALFVADSNPLIFYKAMAVFGNSYLNHGGIIYCEINEAFGAATKDLFMKAGYTETIILKDLNNKDRFIKATKV
jgi:release factor glutamine methyltransferase